MNFLNAHTDVQRIIVLGRSITHSQRPFQKDLRALDPYEVQKILRWKGVCEDVVVLEVDDQKFLEGVTSIVMPEEEISHQIALSIPPHIEIVFDNSHFLRWDSLSANKTKDVESAKIIQADKFFKEMDALLTGELRKSSDLWRQIAGVVFDESGVVMTKYNQCVPTSNHINFVGDPRGQFKKGENIESSIFMHAEAGLIAEAARLGVSLEGKSMYVTTFPCPPCGKLVAYSGIKNLYFKEGYAMLDSEQVLISGGVEMFRVQF